MGVGARLVTVVSRLKSCDGLSFCQLRPGDTSSGKRIVLSNVWGVKTCTSALLLGKGVIDQLYVSTASNTFDFWHSTVVNG